MDPINNWSLNYQEKLKKIEELKGLIKEIEKLIAELPDDTYQTIQYPEFSQKLSSNLPFDSRIIKESEAIFSLQDNKKTISGFLINEQFKNIVSVIPHTLIIIDDLHRIVLWNKMAEKMFGFSSLEVQGRYLEEVIVKVQHREILKKKLDDFKKRNRQGAPNKFYKVECNQKNGSTFISEIHLFSIRMEEYNYLLVMVQDYNNYLQRLPYLTENILNILVKILELRDPYTAGHSKRVTKLSIAIARELKLPRPSVELLRIASLLHDIGKIIIPMEILNKPTELSPYEFGLIKNHCNTGFQILKEIDFPSTVGEIILQHHERINGSGYPRGLKGDKILREAKILAIADVMEAMVSHRPYRPALKIKQAQQEIRQQKDKLFDAEIAKVCLRLFQENKFSF
ncbi:MAG: HD-GYP domain-containing protein [Candidatus Caldatribacteriota bacterium]